MGKEDNYRLLNSLRFPLILGVVFIHSYPGTSEIPYIGFNYFEKIFYTLFLGNCVPFFFLISGYFFFRDGIFNREQFISKFKKRISSMLIPYFLWNLIAMGVKFIQCIPTLSGFFEYSILEKSFAEILWGFFDYELNCPYDFVLWFLRNLILITFIGTPIINFIFKKLNKIGIWLIIILYVLFDRYVPYGIFDAFVFFSMGAYFAIFITDLFKFADQNKWWLIIWVVLYFTPEVESVYLDHLLFVGKVSGGMLFILYVAVISNLCRSEWLHRLAGCVFFIYAFHGLFVSVTRKLVTSAIPVTSSATAFLDYFISFLVLFGVSFLAYLGCSRLFPRFTAILTGKRK